MKFNKWTLGLAAVGVVSLASAARADEKMNSLQTALSNTTISGYVSGSFNWELRGKSSPIEGGGYGGIGTGSGVNTYPSSPQGYIPFQQHKQDGFNLDVVKLSIAKPEDESPWASGYQVDLLFGPDAVGYNPSAFSSGSVQGGGTAADFAIKQAYVTLRTPVGNGIDWKVGVFDTVIGYEVTDAGSNPNYTRSFGYAVEPVEHTGILGSYKVSDELSLSAGIANTLMTGINQRAYDISGNALTTSDNDWRKTLMGSATFTAPSSWGWAAGSSIYGGIVWGFNGGSSYDYNYGYYKDGNQMNIYAGATLNTPWKQLTAGFAFDYVNNFNGGGNDSGDQWYSDVYVLGLYATYKATDKLSFNGRAEVAHGQYYETDGSTKYDYASEMFELTATMEYDLWANVISRLELRWDHAGSYTTPGAFGYSYYANYDGYSGSYDAANLSTKDSVGLYANIIYKF